MINNNDPKLLGKIAIVVLTFGIIAIFIGMIKGFLIALFLAAVFSAMAAPIFERINTAIGSRRGTAGAATLALLIIIILLPGLILLNVIALQAQDIGEQALPWIQSQLRDISGNGSRLPDWLPLHDQIQAWMPQILAKLGELSSNVGGFVVQALSAITSGTAEFLLQLFVMLYAMFYFLKEGPAILDQINRHAILPNDVRNAVFQRAVVVTRATLKGTLLIGVAQGLLGGIGFAIFGVEGAAFWGAVMAIASMLPVVGTSLIWAPAVVYLLATGDTTSAIGLALWSALIVGNIDNILRPILVGGDTEMSDLLVLISTFGGLSMFGAVGLVLGPVVAAVATTLFEVFYKTIHEPTSSRLARDEAPNNAQSAPPESMSVQSSVSAKSESRGLLEVGLTDTQKEELSQLKRELAEVRAIRSET